MSYQTILVYLASQRRAAAVLDFALALAARHDCHLMGVCATPLLAPGIGVSDVPVEVRERFPDELFEEARALERLFAVSADGAGRTAEWCIQEWQHALHDQALMRFARRADLIIAGQPDDRAEWGGNGVADLVMGSGRPVLIIPNSGEFTEIGRNVVVAWNGSREATRAAFDAIPMLREARTVHLLTLQHARRKDAAEDIGDKDHLVGALARHGIEAKLVTHRTTSESPFENGVGLRKWAGMVVIGGACDWPKTTEEHGLG